MKILSSLLGLILFFAGIYLTYWVYLDFESYETLFLGLYLGGSFVLMTLGFFLFLLPLTMKSKKSNVTKLNKETIAQSFTSEDTKNEVINEDIEIEISEVDAIKIIQDEVNDANIPMSQEVIDASFIQDEIYTTQEIIEDSIILIEENPTEEITQNTILDEIEQTNAEDLHETNQFSLSEPFEIVEFRVIGIDSWTSQSVLRKLSEQSLLELSQKSKAGINMTQVTFKQKFIGYISRLDMNKISHKLDQIIEVYPANIIKDGHKIAHFSINLKFKLKEEVHE